MQKDKDPTRWPEGSLLRGVIGIAGLLAVILCARWFYQRHGANFTAETEVSWPFIMIMSLLILSFQFLGGVQDETPDRNVWSQARPIRMDGARPDDDLL